MTDYRVEIQHELDDPFQVTDAILDSIPGILGCGCLHDEINAFKKAIYPPVKQKPEPKYLRSKFVAKYPKAYQDLLRWYFRVQDHNSKLMLDRIMGVLENGQDPLDVKKAVPTRSGQKGLEAYWKPYSRNALQRVRDIVVEHLEGFLYNVLKISPVQNKIKSLVNRGIIRDEADIRDITQDAAIISKMVDALDRGVDLKETMNLAARRPLSTEDMEGIAWARENAAQHMRGLFRTVEDDVNNLVARRGLIGAEAEIEASRIGAEIEQQMKHDIAREVVRGKVAGEDWKRLSSHLKHHWGNYSRDWDRIAFTELSYIEKQGRARDYLKRHGPDVKVIKVPFPDSCEVCRTLYLDETGKPRVFTLSELMAYGSNGDKWFDAETGSYRNKLASKIRYDRKTGKFDGSAGGMLPTIGPLHPWCRCVLMLYAEASSGAMPQYVRDDPKMLDIWNDITEILDAEMTVGKAMVRFVSLVGGRK